MRRWGGLGGLGGLGDLEDLAGGADWEGRGAGAEGWGGAGAGGSAGGFAAGEAIKTVSLSRTNSASRRWGLR